MECNRYVSCQNPRKPKLNGESKQIELANNRIRSQNSCQRAVESTAGLWRVSKVQKVSPHVMVKS